MLKTLNYRFGIGLLLAAILGACAPAQTATPIPTPSRPPVLGTIDGVGGDLRYGGNMVVVGWAADMVRGTPVSGVELVIDGRWTLPATIGDDRPDVVKLLGVPGVSKSGWSIQFSLGTLPPGRHNLGVLVYDSQNRPVLLALVYPFDITAVTSQAAAQGAVQQQSTLSAQTAVVPTTAVKAVATIVPDTVITTSSVITGNFDGVEGTARPGWVVIARGWAVDTKVVAPAAQVDLLLDGKLVSTSNLGGERPDIVKDLGKAGYLKSGWTIRLPLPDAIATGKHKLKAVATDAQGRQTLIGGDVEFEVFPSLAPVKPQATTPVVKDATPTSKEQPKDAPKDAPKDTPKEPASPTPKP